MVDHEGNYLNQKLSKKLAKVRPKIDLGQKMLVVEAEEMEPLQIPLSYYPERNQSLRVCGDQCTGRSYGNKVNSWFSRVLGVSCALVRNDPEASQRSATLRESKTKSSGKEIDEKLISVSKIAFSNESQFLVISQNSLEKLTDAMREKYSNKEPPKDFDLRKTVPHSRFRPNFVLYSKGGDPHWEDEVSRFQIGQQSFAYVGPCARCAMVTIDQSTSKQGKEPLLTLASYRRSNGKIMFGSLFVHDSYNSSPPCFVSLRDRVIIISKSK